MLASELVATTFPQIATVLLRAWELFHSPAQGGSSETGGPQIPSSYVWLEIARIHLKWQVLSLALGETNYSGLFLSCARGSSHATHLGPTLSAAQSTPRNPVPWLQGRGGLVCSLLG